MNIFSIRKTGIDGLLRKYHEEGYYFAEVKVDEDALPRREVVYNVVEGPKVFINDIKFEGNTQFDWFTLRFKVESQPRFWPFIKGQLDNDAIARDVDTLRNMYVAEGYLDAEVDARPQFSDDKTKVTLVFRIRQGPRYRVNKVIFKGNTVFPDEEIFKRLQLGQGVFLTAVRQQHDVKAITGLYGEMGFIEAKVDVRRQFLAPTATMPSWVGKLNEARPALLNVVFEITESDRYTIGKIDIKGNNITQTRLIRQQLRFFPEQIFNTAAIEESRTRLKDTQMFDEVIVTPVGKEPGMRDVLVEVKEAKTAKFIVGAGYSTNNGLLGNVTYTERNFDIMAWPNQQRTFANGRAFKGAGQTLTISAEPGLEMMRFLIDWTEPNLWDQPVQLSNRIYLFTRERESYNELRFGDMVSIGRRFPNHWYLEFAQRLEGVNVGDIEDNAPPQVFAAKGLHFIPGSKLTAVRDTTDSRWNPTKGDRASVSYEQVVGEYNFGRLDASYHVYHTIFTDTQDRKHVIGGKVVAGQIFGDAPVFETFYAGGSGSMRGFEYRGVGPMVNGYPVGGNFLFLAGVQYDFPLITEFLRGNVFVDTGTVETDTGFSSYRASAGFGFRMALPMMGPVPMSLDFGIPLFKQKGDNTQLVSFSVGWQF